MNSWVLKRMLSNKGYKENNFRDSLSYKLPKITAADLADEFIQNSNKR